MATTGNLTAAPLAARPLVGPVTVLRTSLLVAILAIWEGVAASGRVLDKIMPSLATIGRELVQILTHRDFLLKADLSIGSLRLAFDVMIPDFYRHLWITIAEVSGAMTIGGFSGLAVGLLLGANP